MINKNFYRKTNDKKVLHKVGKQWKVVSIALLMAIGGGAAVAATNNNANAETVNDLDTQQVNSAAASFETPQTANSAFTNYSAKASSVAPSSASAVDYYGGASGSAASYFARVNSDNSEATTKYNAINGYVQSLNAAYTPQVNSFNSNYKSLKAEANKDNNLAKNYSAVNANPNTAKTVASLAAKNNAGDATMYQAYVSGAENMYSAQISDASDDVKATQTVQSLVSRMENTNFSSAAVSASAASTVASSEYESASVALDSLGGNINNPAEKWVSDANSLMVYGSALGNNANEMADTFYGMAFSSAIDNLNPTNAIAYKSFYNSVMTSASSSAVSSAVSSAESEFNDDLNNGADAFNTNDGDAYSLASYGSTHEPLNYDNVSLSSNNMNLDLKKSNAFSNFNSGVSAEVNFKMGEFIHAQATKLLAQYAPASNNAKNQAKVHASEVTSAKATLAVMTNMSYYAAANSLMVASVSGDVSYAAAKDQPNGSKLDSSAAAAYVASGYLNEGVSTVASNLNEFVADQYNDDTGLGYNTTVLHHAVNTVVANQDQFNTAVMSHMANLNKPEYKNYKQLVSDLLNNGNAEYGFKDLQNGGTTPGEVASELTNAAKAVKDLNFTELTGSKDLTTNPKGTDKPGNYNGRDTLSKNTTTSDFLNQLNWSSNKTEAAIQKGLMQGNSGKTLLVDALNALGTVNADGTTTIYPNDVTNGDLNSSTHLTDLNHALNKIHDELMRAADATAKVTKNDANNGGLNQSPVAYSVYAPSAASSAVSAALLSSGVDMSQLYSASGAIKNVASTASSAMSNSNSENSNKSYGTQLGIALSVAATSAGTSLSNDRGSLSAYNASNDADVTLAGYFASSYSSDASSASDAASTAYSQLNSFYVQNANDPVFTSADNDYQNALTAASNDKKLGVMNAKIVFNTSAHFLDVVKGAKLHTAVNFGSKGDKTVGYAKKGDRLTVEGVNFNYRGATRYYVLDNATGKKGFFTGQLNYSKPAYLNATQQDANIAVKTLKPVTVFNRLNGGKAVAKIPANQTVDNVTVVTAAPNGDAMGFTKVETKEGNFFTANTGFVKVTTPVTNNTPVAPTNNQPNNTNLDPFYNDNSQL